MVSGYQNELNFRYLRDCEMGCAAGGREEKCNSLPSVSIHRFTIWHQIKHINTMRCCVMQFHSDGVIAMRHVNRQIFEYFWWNRKWVLARLTTDVAIVSFLAPLNSISGQRQFSTFARIAHIRHTFDRTFLFDESLVSLSCYANKIALLFISKAKEFAHLTLSM